MTDPATRPADDWWRSAVVYQVYPRSFADANGDGTGDVNGIRARLPYLADLGIDAIWISPWYPSPLLDGGYDVSDYRDINPDFGTLADADALIAEAHALGLRILIDLVPNHCSWEHPWFKAALAAGKGSPERDLFWFRDGKDGGLPPTNWPAAFGGGAWQQIDDGQWYLHLFDISQPDWNWDNPTVIEEFDAILRFWFDRGIDGFRIDVADSMAKDPALPDVPLHNGEPTREKYVGNPFYDQPGVHTIHQRWRAIADEYADTPQGPRVFVAEAWLSPAERLAQYVRSNELHSAFNFDVLRCAWDAKELREVIDHTTENLWAVGAPATWVLSNHDTIRHRTRYGRDQRDALEGAGVVPTDLELGRGRARAAALLELALPGGAYVYQGDELALPEVENLPEDVLDDPTWERSGHTVRGRDGCRVPIPWSGSGPPFGFGPGTDQPWLPQPANWSALTAETQANDPDSHLNLYKAALRIRRSHPALGEGRLTWDDEAPAGVLSFTRDSFRCLVNLSDVPIPLPPHQQLLLSSEPLTGNRLPVDATAWLQL
ncbi:glycoside hydrolase family 13 protein [Kribbella capetownensis]|uniref:Glycoside hydrolase family 13 protein n=1 Tax=Kribbella capetownensis TaxID=1572659 RepID=A0A4R0JJM9_9ACTN|nr:glycoside hydrolase family 13 protein [Kribbella capetownensis]TCC45954.1 glycoside hydrolase family 13 protein [Kribbella capetownensis]